MPSFVGTLQPPRLAVAPSSPALGQMYYDTGSNTLLWWNGTAWVAASATVVAPAWTAMTPLGSGVANQGAPYAVAAYRKLGDEVELRGMVTAAGSVMVTAFTLPVGNRPLATEVFSWNVGRVDISSAGVISINPGGVGWVSLSGIAFSVQ